MKKFLSVFLVMAAAFFAQEVRAGSIATQLLILAVESNDELTMDPEVVIDLATKEGAAFSATESSGAVSVDYSLVVRSVSDGGKKITAAIDSSISSHTHLTVDLADPPQSDPVAALPLTQIAMDVAKGIHKSAGAPLSISYGFDPMDKDLQTDPVVRTVIFTLIDT